MQCQYCLPHGQCQNYVQTMHPQNFPYQQGYNGGRQQPHNQNASQQIMNYTQTHHPTLSVATSATTPTYLKPNNNRKNKRGKNGSQQLVPPGQTHQHPVPPGQTHQHLVPPGQTHQHPVPPGQTHQHPVPHGQTHKHPVQPAQTASHTNAHSTPSVAASDTSHASAKSTGSVGSTKSGKKVRNQNYATKMLSDSGTPHELDRTVILGKHTSDDQDVREAKEMYKIALEQAMSLSSKGMKYKKFLPSDKDNFEKAPNMKTHLGLIAQDLKNASEHAHRSLENTVTSNYTEDSIIHEHNRKFLEKNLSSHGVNVQKEHVELEKLQRQVSAMTHLDDDSRKKLTNEIAVVRRKIDSYSIFVEKAGDNTEKKMNLVASQQSKISCQNEKQREYQDKLHATKLNEVEGGLIAEASRTFNGLDLSLAFSTQGLEELKKHIEKLETLQHHSSPQTKETHHTSIEVMHEGKESDNPLLPRKNP